MKILFFINGIYLGGKERRLIELMKELKIRTDFQFELAVMNQEVNYRKEIDSLNIKIHYLIRKRKNDISIFKVFFLLCRNFKPNLIHCWDGMTAIYSIPTCMLLNIKLINGMVVDAPTKSNILNKKWWKSKITFPFSKFIIANSKAGLEAYKVPVKKGIRIYNGFNFNRVNNLIDPGKLRCDLNIKTKFIIGMVATHSEFKDYKTYFKAANLVLKRRNDVTFLAIGSKTDSINLRDFIDDELRNRIKLLGKRSDVESLINSMDICILCSFTEGISNSIIEYMALKKPVIATQGGGTSELVLNNKTGFLIQVGNISELTKKIEILLENEELRLEMGNAGKERIENSFSIDQMMESYISHYKKVMTQ